MHLFKNQLKTKTIKIIQKVKKYAKIHAKCIMYVYFMSLVTIIEIFYFKFNFKYRHR